MAERPARALSRHDMEVKRLADMLSGAGYRVRADVPGYPRPGTIQGSGGSGSWRPDIMATKDGIRTIIEVETDESHYRDRDQRRAFRDYAKRHRDTTIFRTVRI